MTTQPVVNLVDNSGNIVSSNATVTASSSGGTLSGATTVNAVNGVATFSDLGFSGTVGQNYTLSFASTGLTSATSNSIQLTGDGHIAFANSPQSNGTKFVELPSNQWDLNQGELALSIAIRDSLDNLLIDTSQIDSINAEIISGPGTLTVNPSGRSIIIPRPSNGAIYSFSVLSIEAGNTTVRVSIRTVDGITHSIPDISIEFLSTNQTKGSVIIETQPILGRNGDFITQPIVKLVDKNGNIYTNDNTTVITARLISGSGSLNANNQSTMVTSKNGVGKYTELFLSQMGNNTQYQLAFFANGFSPALSNKIQRLTVAELIREDIEKILERDLSITVKDLESSFSDAAKNALSRKN
ncbi:hypothetical protein AT251_15435 [Enterovibrio nigricans]|nr:hypothetical protein [Enterovibrio nigricans]PKF49894.1 hypothetical protein AT251_15435 [Enterovibrio nigricans]